jgi:hypothetical protein
MQAQRPIAVYGATGHTGRFVLAELRRRDLPAVAIARDPSRHPLPDMPVRQAAVDDAAALDRALAGCGVLINCAGPFLDTARPLVQAALRAGCAYLDVTAEQASAQAVLEFDGPARAAGVAVVPAAGFYGGLADLLASALLDEDGEGASLSVGVALSDWWPTAGTRVTGARNQVPRVIVDGGRIVPMPLPAQTREWAFGGPFGAQAMVELPFSEVVTLAHHFPLRSARSFINQASLQQIRDPATPAPTAVDAQGRSGQRFMMEVVATAGSRTRRAWAAGQDIYAVSAPMLVEAALRLLNPASGLRGALVLGQLGDAREFLGALAPEHLSFGID